MSSNSDLLTSLNEMYEAANRRAEAVEWRDNYATGYSDGLWDARTLVREAEALEGAYKAAYEKELVLHTSVLDQYRHLEGEMDGLVHMTNKIRDLADEALMDGSDLSDAAVEALIEIIRLLDGGDA